jgi:hypothetical protein
MIRHHVDEAVASYRVIIGELVPLIRRSREANDSDDVVVVIPEELARRLVYLSTENEAGR